MGAEEDRTYALEDVEPIPVRLKCGKCGHTDEYMLTRVFVSPKAMVAKRPRERAEGVAFADYFRCRECGSAWPWELVGDGFLALTSVLIGRLDGVEDDRVVVGEARLFDGSPYRSAAAAEEYLLGILKRERENAFVWDRLGNVYEKAGLLDKAVEAFKAALEADPKALESHFSLGHIAYEEGRYEEAAEHLHQVITLAWKNREVPKATLRKLVREALRVMTHVTYETEGRIPMLPSSPPEAAESSSEPTVIYLTAFDLGEEADQERLVDMVLGKIPEPVRGFLPRGEKGPRPRGSAKKRKRRRR